jgi:hypothetical protein
VGSDHLELRLRLAAAVEREAGFGPVEVVVLDDAAIGLAGRVITGGVVVYSRDGPARVITSA